MAMRSAVVLPQPDGPIRATTSPSATVKLSRSSARTVCTRPSMRSAKRLEISMRLTSPISMRLRDEFERGLTRGGIEHCGEVYGFRNIADLHQFVVHPRQVVG